MQEVIMQEETVQKETMQKGIVQWFDIKKGFGFIKPKKGKKDIFVHIKDVHDSGYDQLFKRDEVEYELLEDTWGRKRAVNITAYEPL